MTDDAETYTQAEIVRLLKRLDTTVTTLSTDIKRQEANYVTRSELTLVKEAHDREIRQVKDEINGVKESTSPVRVSGWMIAGFAVSAIVGGGSLIALVITLMQFGQ